MNNKLMIPAIRSKIICVFMKQIFHYRLKTANKVNEQAFFGDELKEIIHEYATPSGFSFITFAFL